MQQAFTIPVSSMPDAKEGDILKLKVLNVSGDVLNVEPVASDLNQSGDSNITPVSDMANNELKSFLNQEAQKRQANQVQP